MTFATKSTTTFVIGIMDYKNFYQQWNDISTFQNLIHLLITLQMPHPSIYLPSSIE